MCTAEPLPPLKLTTNTTGASSSNSLSPASSHVQRSGRFKWMHGVTVGSSRHGNVAPVCLSDARNPDMQTAYSTRELSMQATSIPPYTFSSASAYLRGKPLYVLLLGDRTPSEGNITRTSLVRMFQPPKLMSRSPSACTFHLSAGSCHL